MKRFAAILAAIALGLASDGAAAAPQSLPMRAIDLDLKGAAVKNVFRLLGDVAGKSVVLDPCVSGTVDLRLVNTPLPLVFDVLAAKLHLIYDDNDPVINVRCEGTNATTTPPRVSLREVDAPLPDVLDRLATASHLAGVDYRAKARPPVTITITDVRLSTAVVALGDATRLQLTIANNRLLVTD